MAIPEFLSGGGEMGQRIREFDWAATPLGPFDAWPQSLRTCIRIMLASRQPIWIGWGKQLIKFYNDPYQAIVGGKHPWALGQPASVVWKDIWRDIDPLLRQVMEHDEGTYVESQLLIMERNGYPEETYYTFSYTPIPGDDGGTAGMICANSDDTERILGERQLRTLMLLSNRLTDPQSNEEAIDRTITTLKENRHDFPFVDYYSIGEEGGLMADCELAVATRKPQVIENMGEKVAAMSTGAWEIPPHRGIVLPIFQSGSREINGFLVVGLNPYRLPDEKYMGFFGLVSDQITNSLANLHVLEVERKKLEAMAEIDRAKTTFFSNISHEFRTPLTLLLGPIEDVLNDPESKDVNRYRMGIAYRNVLRMQKLVNTLLDFSRIEAGRMEGNYSRTDIYALTRDLASSFRSAVEKAGMRLEVSGGVIEDEVYVDIDKWEQIILNLVSNAFKYSKEGTIGVFVEQEGKMIVVRVSDTGVGIPEGELVKIFERFHRIGNIQGRSQEGTGIGLAMVKELVRLHHGSIRVTSTVGVGSTFTVAIPTGREHLQGEKIVASAAKQDALKHAEPFVAEALKWLPGLESGGSALPAGSETPGGSALTGGPGSALAAGGAGRGKPKVLLADDNADMREYVQRLLSGQFTVITAMDGMDAFDKLLVHQPDLVLSDIMMPMLDGFGLLEKIRNHPEVKHTPVIFLSARAGEEAKVEGLDAGADDYLVKPFSAKELLARVDANIRIARSRMEHAALLEQEVRNQTRELREMNISLEKSNEDLQQFAHVASHDLKEPVRKIRTFISRLQEEFGGTLAEPARLYLDKIRQATDRMFSMIEGVLAYSILNGSDETAAPIDLNEILSNIELDLEVAIGEKKAIIDREKLPKIEGVDVLIHQLFYNLINNSLKFARVDAAPVIRIRCRVVAGHVAAGRVETAGMEGQFLEITLSDNGIGFEAEHADRIFNTFARLHARDKYEGTGLGLALCKKIVERHHGQISATGEKGKGAIFTIQLPLIQQQKSI